MPSQELIEQVTAQAYAACQSGFQEEENREMNEDEQNISARASQLGVLWTTTQPVSRFANVSGVGSVEDSIKQLTTELENEIWNSLIQGFGAEEDFDFGDGVGSPEDREARREVRKRFRAAVQECKAYVEANWEGEGVGFIIALITAIIWHLIVVLIVRWIIRHYFENPSVASQMCLPG